MTCNLWINSIPSGGLKVFEDKNCVLQTGIVCYIILYSGIAQKPIQSFITQLNPYPTPNSFKGSIEEFKKKIWGMNSSTFCFFFLSISDTAPISEKKVASSFLESVFSTC